jgi:hypothetical protein
MAQVLQGILAIAFLAFTAPVSAFLGKSHTVSGLNLTAISSSCSDAVALYTPSKVQLYEVDLRDKTLRLAREYFAPNGHVIAAADLACDGVNRLVLGLETTGRAIDARVVILTPQGTQEFPMGRVGVNGVVSVGNNVRLLTILGSSQREFGQSPNTINEIGIKVLEIEVASGKIRATVPVPVSAMTQVVGSGEWLLQVKGQAVLFDPTSQLFRLLKSPCPQTIVGDSDGSSMRLGWVGNSSLGCIFKNAQTGAFSVTYRDVDIDGVVRSANQDIRKLESYHFLSDGILLAGDGGSTYIDFSGPLGNPRSYRWSIGPGVIAAARGQSGIFVVTAEDGASKFVSLNYISSSGESLVSSRRIAARHTFTRVRTPMSRGSGLSGIFMSN